MHIRISSSATETGGLSNLQQIMLQPIGYDADRKAVFHREACRLMHGLATALALPDDSFDIRSNKGGIAVSGEITLHGEHVYLQISQSCMGRGYEVLFRRCNGCKDYSGEQNHFASATEFSDPQCLAEIMRRTLRLTE